MYNSLLLDKFFDDNKLHFTLTSDDPAGLFVEEG